MVRRYTYILPSSTFGYNVRTNDKPVPRPAKKATRHALFDDGRQKKRLCGLRAKQTLQRKKGSLVNASECRKSWHTGLLDRGYYSKGLLRRVSDSQAFGVWILKINAFRGARPSFNPWKTKTTCLVSGKGSSSLIVINQKKNRPSWPHERPVIQKSRRDIKAIHASRWRIEESLETAEIEP